MKKIFAIFLLADCVVILSPPESDCLEQTPLQKRIAGMVEQARYQDAADFFENVSTNLAYVPRNDPNCSELILNIEFEACYSVANAKKALYNWRREQRYAYE